MNVLDENVNKVQRELLRHMGIRTLQVGDGFGRLGLADEEILPMLLQLQRPTFFSSDSDFYVRRFCHAHYCLVYLEVPRHDVAVTVRRFLRHPDYRTQAQRMGKIFWASETGIRFWRLHGEAEETAAWPR